MTGLFSVGVFFSQNVLMTKHMHDVLEKTKEYTSIKY